MGMEMEMYRGMWSGLLQDKKKWMDNKRIRDEEMKVSHEYDDLTGVGERSPYYKYRGSDVEKWNQTRRLFLMLTRISAVEIMVEIRCLLAVVDSEWTVATSGS